MKRYNVLITFLPNKKGELYELANIKLRTKPMSRAKAIALAKKEVEPYWKYYSLKITAV